MEKYPIIMIYFGLYIYLSFKILDYDFCGI